MGNFQNKIYLEARSVKKDVKNLEKELLEQNFRAMNLIKKKQATNLNEIEMEQ